MPLILDGERIPSHWAQKSSARLGLSGYDKCVRVALINNMPDAALEDTELQFFGLLDDASDDLPVFLKLYSLTGVSRSDRGARRINEFYFGMDDLWTSQFDGVIITGTEPRQSNLRDEAYWPALTNIFDWAERNTVSTVLSCLAAHAGVLYHDGIERHPLTDKQFGVFEFARVAHHEMTNGAGELVCFPHSRWNEVRADSLTENGYLVLTRSAEGGVDSFVKKKKRSLFVHFQGHPEYGPQTLLKEYRRDIKRFLRRERDTYPSMPKSYFDAERMTLLNNFRNAALSQRQEDVIESFPEAALAGTLQKTWHASAMRVYRNWLRYILLNKSEVSRFSAVQSVPDSLSGRRPVPFRVSR